MSSSSASNVAGGVPVIAMKSAPRSNAVRIDEFASKLEMLMISRSQFNAAVAA